MVDRKEHIYTIVMFSILACMAGFMLAFASKQSFWVDELDWTIGIISGKTISINGRLFTPMFQTLLEQGYNLPLYYIIIKPLYELLPYGETFLLIPSILFVIAGIVIMGKTGKIINGDIGFFSVCIAVSSETLIRQGGWELRPYSITFCFSSLALLMYIKRLKAETNKNIFLYGASLVLLLYCHWFGSILALFYAFTDLYLYLRKKISLKCIFAYIFAGILFFSWFLMMVFHITNNLSSYWGRILSIVEPVLTISYLLSFAWLYCLLFGIGFILILLKNIRENKKETAGVSRIWLFMNLSIIWTILPIYIYSRFINPSGSFYAQKYFFVIMPHVFLITAYGFSEIFYALQRSLFMKTNRKNLLYCLVIAVFCFILFQNYKETFYQETLSPPYPMREPYREVAEYLSQDGQAFSANSLIICSCGSAWIEYYFNKRGFSIPANVAISGQSTAIQFIDDGQYIQPILLSEEDILRYDRLYLFEVHDYFQENLIEAIDQNYRFTGEWQESNLHMPKMDFVKQTIMKIFHIQSYDIPPSRLLIYEKPLVSKIGPLTSQPLADVLKVP